MRALAVGADPLLDADARGAGDVHAARHRRDRHAPLFRGCRWAEQGCRIGWGMGQSINQSPGRMAIANSFQVSGGCQTLLRGYFLSTRVVNQSIDCLIDPPPASTCAAECRQNAGRMPAGCRQVAGRLISGQLVMALPKTHNFPLTSFGFPIEWRQPAGRLLAGCRQNAGRLIFCQPHRRCLSPIRPM